MRDAQVSYAVQTETNKLVFSSLVGNSKVNWWSRRAEKETRTVVIELMEV